MVRPRLPRSGCRPRQRLYEEGLPSEHPYRRRYVAGDPPGDRAEVEVHSRLFWEETHRVEAAVRALDMMRRARER